MSVKLPPFPNNMMIILSSIWTDQEEEDSERFWNRYISTNWNLLREFIWNDIKENAYCVFFDLNSVKTNKTFFELKDYHNRVEWLNAIIIYIAESIVRDISCFRNLNGHKFTSSLRILHTYDDTYPKHLIKVPETKHDFGVYFPSDKISDESELGEALPLYSQEEWKEKEASLFEKRMYEN